MEAIEVKDTPVEQQDPFHGTEPSFTEASRFREDGTLPERAKQAAENKAAGGESREKQGRFTKVLENWREEANFARAVNDGMVTPTDDMDPDTWLAARVGQIRNGAKITMPKDAQAEPAENEGKGAPKEPDQREANYLNQRAQELVSAGASPEAAQDIAHREVEHVKKLWSEHADHFQRVSEAIAYCPDLDELMETGRQIPFPPGLQNDLAGLDNSGEVLIYLLRNPQMAVQLTQMLPSISKKALRDLSSNLAAFSADGGQETKQERRQSSAPPPVEPVGARSSAKGFDVYDDSGSADEWAKKRNEQVYGRRR